MKGSSTGWRRPGIFRAPTYCRNVSVPTLAAWRRQRAQEAVMSTMSRFIAAAAIAGSALLSGCAALNTIGSDVASYGSWPPHRKPGSYSVSRLPSQQLNPRRQDLLEAAAAQALQSAGFWPAPEGTKGDVTVQVGARI